MAAGDPKITNAIPGFEAWDKDYNYDDILKKIVIKDHIPNIKAPMANKDINWHEYIPARPPATGEYFVYWKEDNRFLKWQFGTFDPTTLTWSVDDKPVDGVVLYYAKFNLPK